MLLSAGAFFCLCVLYQAVRLRHLSTLREILVYYGVPTALACLMFLASRLREPARINLRLALVTSGAMLFAGELFLASLEPLSPAEGLARAAARAGVEFDRRTRAQVVTDLRERGDRAYARIAAWPVDIEVQYGSRRVYSLGGISRVTTVMDNESGRYITYRSDEHGFNNPPGQWQADRVDLAAVGDSYLLGYGVEPERNMAGILRRNGSTLSLAMAGNGPLVELASIREYLPAFTPRHVLWFYYEGNDLLNLREEAAESLLVQYLENPGFRMDLVSLQEQIDRRLMVRHDEALAVEMDAPAQPRAPGWSKRELVATLTLTQLRLRLGLAPPSIPYTDTERKLFRRVLAEAKATVSTWQGELILVYLPEWARFGRPRHANPDRDLVMAMVDELEIGWVDGVAAFADSPDPLAYFPYRSRFGHYTEEGYRRIAEAVSQRLESRPGNTGGRGPVFGA